MEGNTVYHHIEHSFIDHLAISRRSVQKYDLSNRFYNTYFVPAHGVQHKSPQGQSLHGRLLQIRYGQNLGSFPEKRSWRNINKIWLHHDNTICRTYCSRIFGWNRHQDCILPTIQSWSNLLRFLFDLRNKIPAKRMKIHDELERSGRTIRSSQKYHAVRVLEVLRGRGQKCIEPEGYYFEKEHINLESKTYFFCTLLFEQPSYTVDIKK